MLRVSELPSCDADTAVPFSKEERREKVQEWIFSEVGEVCPPMTCTIDALTLAGVVDEEDVTTTDVSVNEPAERKKRG